MGRDHDTARPAHLRARGVTHREAQVLEALGDHLSNAEIAQALGIGVRTVESHVSNLLHKFGASDRVGLLASVGWSAPPKPVSIEPPFALLRMNDSGMFVGRDAERRDLVSAWERVRDGAHQFVLISGEAGIGKSRLASEFARTVWKDGAAVLYGRCDPDREGPFEAFGDAIAPYVNACDPARLQHELGEVAGDLARIVPHAGRRLPRPPIAEALSDPNVARLRLFEAAHRVLRGAATSSRLLVVLDDLHWAPAPTLALLMHLLRGDVLSGVMFVGTSRSSDESGDVDDFAAQVSRDMTHTHIELQGLHRTEVAQLVSHQGGDLSPSRDVLAMDIYAEGRGIRSSLWS